MPAEEDVVLGVGTVIGATLEDTAGGPAGVMGVGNVAGVTKVGTAGIGRV
jgi:hypothetical protein